MAWPVTVGTERALIASAGPAQTVTLPAQAMSSLTSFVAFRLARQRNHQLFAQPAGYRHAGRTQSRDSAKRRPESRGIPALFVDAAGWTRRWCRCWDCCASIEPRRLKPGRFEFRRRAAARRTGASILSGTEAARKIERLIDDITKMVRLKRSCRRVS